MLLRHLEYFVAVAEELHFARAASRLYISQPALSQQIKNLERRLGVQLLDRTSRSVELTTAGTIFLEQAREILSQVQRSITRVREAAEGRAGSLRIGFIGSSVCDIMPRLLPHYRNHVPAVEVELLELPTTSQVHALLDHRIDVGIARDPYHFERISSIPLRSESLVVALSTRHPLAVRASLSLTELATEDFIMNPRVPAPGIYDLILALCRSAGFYPAIVQEATQYATSLSLVAAGIGIAVVPEPVSLLRSSGVRYVPIDDAKATSHVAMLHRFYDPSPIVDEFIRIALDLLSDN